MRTFLRMALLAGVFGWLSWPGVDGARGGEAPAASAANPPADKSDDDAAKRRLVVPEDCDDAKFKELLGNRTDWESVQCSAKAASDAWVDALVRCPALRDVSFAVGSGQDALTVKGLLKLTACKQLRSLQVSGGDLVFTDEVLAAFVRGWPELESLGLETYGNDSGKDAGITADGLVVLGEAKKLKSLSLRPLSVDERLAAALAHCPDFERLAFWSETVRFNGPTLAALAALPKLTSIRVFAAPEIGDETVSAWAKKPDLRELILDRATRVTDAGLKALAGQASLQRLWLGVAPEAGDEGVAALAKGCPALSQLFLRGAGPARLTDEGLAALGALPKLDALQLSGLGNVTDAGLERLARSPVERISFWGTEKVTDKGLLALAKFPNLRSVMLADAKRVTVEGVDKLTELKPKLEVITPVSGRIQRIDDGKTLRLTGKCDDEGFKKLMGDRTDWETVWCVAELVGDAWVEAMARCPNLRTVTIHSWSERSTLSIDGVLKLIACKQLRSLQVSGRNLTFTDEALAALVRGCPELESLSAQSNRDGGGVTADGLVVLGEAKKLKTLHLNPQSADGRLVAALAHCPDLEGLTLWSSGARFDAPALAALAALPKLKSIQVYVTSEVGDETVSLWAKKPGLRELILEGTAQVTDAGLKALAGQTSLQRLWLGVAAGVGDEGIAALAKGCPRLSQLFLQGAGPAGLTDKGLAALGELPRLGMLRLSGLGDVTDAGLEGLARSPVGELSLRGTEKITDKGLLALAKFPNLREAMLTDAKLVTVGGVAKLKELKPKLEVITPVSGRSQQVADGKTLRIEGKCDDEGFKKLMAGRTDWETVWCMAEGVSDVWVEALARCPNLRTVSLQSWGEQSALSIDGVLKLAACKQLRSLQVSGRDLAFTDEVLAAFVRGCPELESLSVQSNRDGGVTADGLVVLGEAKKLKTLNLNPQAADGRLVAALAHCPDLEGLTLWSPGARFDAPALAALAAFPKLRSIQVFATPEVGDETVLLWAKKPGLRELILEGTTQVTDAGLKALAGQTSLQRLWLGVAAEVGDEAVTALAKGCPALSQLFLRGAGPTRLTDEGLGALGGLPRLGSLQLSGLGNITDAGLERLSRTPMGWFTLGGTEKLTDKGLLALAKFPNLQNATLPEARLITAEGLGKLKALKPNLQVATPISAPQGNFWQAAGPKGLQIPEQCDDAGFRKLIGERTDWETVECLSDNTSDEWMAALARCPDLRKVTIRNWQNLHRLTGTGLRALAACGKLQNLSVQQLRAPFTDEDLSALVQGCPELSELRIQQWNQNSRLTADGLLALGGLKRLKSLQLQLGAGAGTDVVRLAQTLADNCPELGSLALLGNWQFKFDTPALLVLARMPALTSLQVNGASDVGDEAVMALAKDRPGLTTLSLQGSGKLTDAGLAALADSPRLQSVTLGAAPDAGDAGLIAFCRNKPQLGHVAIGGLGNLTDEGFAALAGLPQLNGLALREASNITDDGLIRFAAKGGRNLWWMDLSAATAVTDKGLAALAKLPRLNQLQLPLAEGITAEGEAAFKKLKPQSHLVTPLNAPRYHGRDNLAAARAAGVKAPLILRIPENCDKEALLKLMAGRTDWEAVRSECRALDDSWMEELVKCPNLKSFSNTFSSPFRLTSAGMALLARCPQLKTLELCSEVLLEDDDLAAIAKGCPELTEVHICDGKGAAITDEGLSALARCRNLRRLTIREVKADAVGDHPFLTFANDAPNLAELNITGRLAVTDAGLAALGHCAQLRELTLNAPAAGDETLTGLARCLRLTDLTLNGGAEFTDQGLAALAAHPELRHLRLSHARKITDAGLAGLAKVKNLSVLNLGRATLIGDEGIKSLSACTRLNMLELGGRKITDDGVAGLAKLGNLNNLNLSAATGITDKGVETLVRNHPNLYSLNLRSATELTDASLGSLARMNNLRDLNLAGAKGLTSEGMARLEKGRDHFRFTRPKVAAPAPKDKRPEVEVF